MQVAIKPIRDEEDHNLVFEVCTDTGFATNTVTIDQALSLARDLLTEAKTEFEAEQKRRLEAIARTWSYEHGWRVYEGISDDIRAHADTGLTEDDLDTILNLLEDADITFH